MIPTCFGKAINLKACINHNLVNDRFSQHQWVHLIWLDVLVETQVCDPIIGQVPPKVLDCLFEVVICPECRPEPAISSLSLPLPWQAAA